MRFSTEGNEIIEGNAMAEIKTEADPATVS